MKMYFRGETVRLDGTTQEAHGGIFYKWSV